MAEAGDRASAPTTSGADSSAVAERSPGKRTRVQAKYGVQRRVAPPPALEATTTEAPTPRSDPFDFESMSAPPVQRKGERDEDPAMVHEAAERGTRGSAGPLPFADQIQRAFGHHDVSDIRAHTGGAATEAATAMGAEAYATGNDVVFGGGAPSLHTAAHEAAHVVQQRGGVQLKGGVGQEGDPYERHADAVADAVVAGRSAEALLDPFAGAGAGGAAVQRALLPKRAAPPAFQDGLSVATVVATAQAKEPAPKKVGADWSGAANKAARKAFKDVCGETDQAKFDGLVSDPRFLQPGEVHKEVFGNKQGVLPADTTYTEYDMAKYKGDPKARGEERIVIGANGKKYYTANHYIDFAEFD